MEIHCSNPSSHTFEGSLGEPVEPHVIDPDPENNSDSLFTVDAIAQADVKVVGVTVLNPPAEIDVSEDTDITVRSTLHNNGGYGPVEVALSYWASAPDDCSVATVSSFPVILQVIVDVVDEHTWTIHCEGPSEHTFEFVTDIVGITEAHVRDPDEGNNSASAPWIVDVVAAPVGGIAGLPDASGSPGRNYVPLAALAAAALVALGAGAWYARRRWLS
jgi:hypothetical protein